MSQWAHVLIEDLSINVTLDYIICMLCQLKIKFSEVYTLHYQECRARKEVPPGLKERLLEGAQIPE